MGSEVNTVPKCITASGRLLARRAILLLSVFTLLIATALAQEGRARLSGRLSNGQGDPIPNAVIVVCNREANFWFITSTDARGSFELADLPANRFSIEVTFAAVAASDWNPGRDQIWGFSPWSDTVTLQAGQNLQRDIQLGGLTLQPRTSQTSSPCTPRRAFSVMSADGLASLFIDATPVYPARCERSERRSGG